MAGAFASSAWGQSITIENAGFEAPSLGAGQFQAGVPGWTNFGSVEEIGVWHVGVPADFDAAPPEGVQVGYIFGGPADAGLAQVLTTTLAEDASYTLTANVGNSKGFSYNGYRVQLLAGGSLLAEVDGGEAGSTNPASGEFVTVTVNYSYDAGLHSTLVGEPLEIRLLTRNEDGGVAETEFDDVQLTVALANPVADPGGPYSVSIPNGSLSLDGSASLPSNGESIVSWEWDLTNDNDFTDASGVTPATIDYATLTAAPPTGFGMVQGNNTIQLRVTDSAAKTSTVEGIVTLSQPLVIYEPFNDLDPTLAGNTPGQGLTGTWSGQSRVENDSLSSDN